MLCDAPLASSLATLAAFAANASSSSTNPAANMASTRRRSARSSSSFVARMHRNSERNLIASAAARRRRANISLAGSPVESRISRYRRTRRVFLGWILAAETGSTSRSLA